MENYLLSPLVQGQNRAPNTIHLRKLYNDYSSEAQVRGEEAVPFEQWAKMKYPELKILNQ